MTLETFLNRGQKDAGSPEQQQLQTFPPMMGLLLLLARPLRPWLIGFFSILIFLVTGTAVAMLFGLHRLDLSGMKTAWVVAGIMFLVIAVVFVWWVLRRGSWHLPVGALALLSAMGLLIFWLLPNYEVGPFHLRPLLIALPVNVLQVFVVRLLFKLFTITRHNLRFERLLATMIYECREGESSRFRFVSY